jgi:hypothetical protein
MSQGKRTTKKATQKRAKSTPAIDEKPKGFHGRRTSRDESTRP